MNLEQDVNRLSSDSQYNDGHGVRYTPTLLGLYLPVPGKKCRINAVRPKTLGNVFYCSEDADMESFTDLALANVEHIKKSSIIWEYKIVADEFRSKTIRMKWSMHGKEGSLDRVCGYDDMISQIGKNADIKIVIEEIEVISSIRIQPKLNYIQDENTVDPDTDDGTSSSKKSRTVWYILLLFYVSHFFVGSYTICGGSQD